MKAPPLRSALIVAHPGHELRVFGWLSLSKPHVCVFTDGSGSQAQSRLYQTTQILNSAGATPGKLYGRFTDREWYALLMAQNPEPFVSLAEEIARWLESEAISMVVGDAIEGYNSAHDVCRLIINAAVELASLRSRTSISNFDFPLVGPPDQCEAHLLPHCQTVILEEEIFQKKLKLACQYTELLGEVEEVMRSLGEAPFRVERLRPASRTYATDGLCEEKPYYEQYGEKRVSSGAYPTVLRRQEHILPIARELTNYIARQA